MVKKIKIESWKAKVPIFGEDNKVVGSKEIDENLLVALNNLIAAKKPEEIPRGLDKFRLFGRLAKAFDKAEKTKILEIDDSDYDFLKKTVEKDIPSVWGFNEPLAKAIEDFLNIKDE